jgi:N-acetylglucosamine-6-phosphate deacetylase
VIGDRARGGLGQGKRADVTLLDDTLSVQLTAIGGGVAFNRIGPQL